MELSIHQRKKVTKEALKKVKMVLDEHLSRSDTFPSALEMRKINIPMFLQNLDKLYLIHHACAGEICHVLELWDLADIAEGVQSIFKGYRSIYESLIDCYVDKVEELKEMKNASKVHYIYEEKPTQKPDPSQMEMELARLTRDKQITDMLAAIRSLTTKHETKKKQEAQKIMAVFQDEGTAIGGVRMDFADGEERSDRYKKNREYFDSKLDEMISQMEKGHKIDYYGIEDSRLLLELNKRLYKQMISESEEQQESLRKTILEIDAKSKIELSAPGELHKMVLLNSRIAEGINSMNLNAVGVPNYKELMHYLSESELELFHAFDGKQRELAVKVAEIIKNSQRKENTSVGVSTSLSTKDVELLEFNSNLLLQLPSNDMKKELARLKQDSSNFTRILSDAKDRSKVLEEIISDKNKLIDGYVENMTKLQYELRGLKTQMQSAPTNSHTQLPSLLQTSSANLGQPANKQNETDYQSKCRELEVRCNDLRRVFEGVKTLSAKIGAINLSAESIAEVVLVRQLTEKVLKMKQRIGELEAIEVADDHPPEKSTFRDILGKQPNHPKANNEDSRQSFLIWRMRAIEIKPHNKKAISKQPSALNTGSTSQANLLKSASILEGTQPVEQRKSKGVDKSFQTDFKPTKQPSQIIPAETSKVVDSSKQAQPSADPKPTLTTNVLQNLQTIKPSSVKSDTKERSPKPKPAPPKVTSVQGTTSSPHLGEAANLEVISMETNELDMRSKLSEATLQNIIIDGEMSHMAVKDSSNTHNAVVQGKTRMLSKSTETGTKIHKSAAYKTLINGLDSIKQVKLLTDLFSMLKIANQSKQPILRTVQFSNDSIDILPDPVMKKDMSVHSNTTALHTVNPTSKLGDQYASDRGEHVSLVLPPVKDMSRRFNPNSPSQQPNAATLNTDRTQETGLGVTTHRRNLSEGGSQIFSKPSFVKNKGSSIGLLKYTNLSSEGQGKPALHKHTLSELREPSSIAEQYNYELRKNQSMLSQEDNEKHLARRHNNKQGLKAIRTNLNLDEEDGGPQNNSSIFSSVNVQNHPYFLGGGSQASSAVFLGDEVPDSLNILKDNQFDNEDYLAKLYNQIVRPQGAFTSKNLKLAAVGDPVSELQNPNGEDFKEFKARVRRFAKDHMRCGGECKHLKRFYQRFGLYYVPKFVRNRKTYHMPISMIGMPAESLEQKIAREPGSPQSHMPKLKEHTAQQPKPVFI